jgi:hypothetical protein
MVMLFERNHDNKSHTFADPSEVPPKAPVFVHTKFEVNTQGLNTNDRKGFLSVGYPTQ